ncbi:MAG: nucleotidyltransferase domain-containing protein [Methanophagales archaeon]|nr:nucleotidyltransferase domain-containing protein [Methanophagales archaeon]
MRSFVVEESLNSVKVFWLEQEKLIREIYRVAREIGKADENILKIILFGSLAEKRAVPGSDVDILIILKSNDKSFMDRLVEWSEKFSLDFPLEIFPYTEKELNIPVVMEAVKKGIPLFERNYSGSKFRGSRFKVRKR